MNTWRIPLLIWLISGKLDTRSSYLIIKLSITFLWKDIQKIFKGIKKTINATRYHSLIIDRKTLGKDLLITAETKDKVIMGVMHKKYKIHGVQFHPESIKTPEGMKLLKNFIKL